MPKPVSAILSGWGRYPRLDCEIFRVRDPSEAVAVVANRQTLIARGNGRSYGDAALNPGGVLSTLRSDRLLAFDPQRAVLECEAGTTLADILDFAVPRGFFPPVTPGTQHVTLGGMIAADVHGKNHHVAGGFCRYVDWIDLLTADGTIRRCSRAAEPDLFAATCGGMGLTGIILCAAFRLIAIETAKIRRETLRAPDLDAALRLCEASAGWTYTVAWIDCAASGADLGRSLVYRGEHATRDETNGLSRIGEASLTRNRRTPRRVPVDLPGWALSPPVIRAFNALYYRRGAPGTAFVDLETYFYPLDALSDWNRVYGRRGFVQYQCVIPKPASQTALTAILGRIARAGAGSFLAVLKLLGAEGEGLLSFPMEGYTLALDFPAASRNLDLLNELDAIVSAHGGRVYLAKDARTAPAMIRSGYPRLDSFRAVRRRYDPDGKFASALSRRLEL